MSDVDKTFSEITKNQKKLNRKPLSFGAIISQMVVFMTMIGKKAKIFFGTIWQKIKGLKKNNSANLETNQSLVDNQPSTEYSTVNNQVTTPDEPSDSELL